VASAVHDIVAYAYLSVPLLSRMPQSGDIQISALARELNIKSGKIVKLLARWGAVRTRLVPMAFAERLRAHYGRPGKGAQQPARPRHLKMAKIKGPVAHLIEFAASRGIPEFLVREHLKMTGFTLDRMHSLLVTLPPVNPPGFARAAVSAFRQQFNVKRLPFTLLPRGTWDADHVISHYNLANNSKVWAGPKLDFETFGGFILPWSEPLLFGPLLFGR
jgi:hypothetical protein